MLKFDANLPSSLKPLLMAPPMSEPVCKMQTPTLFTVAHASQQLQSVDTDSYSQLNPLLSPNTLSSCLGERPLFIGSNTSTPTAGTGLLSSSQLLQGLQPPQLPPQNSSWADEVTEE